MAELVIMAKQCQRINQVKWLVEEQSESGILQLVTNARGMKLSIIVGTCGRFVLS